MTLFSLSAAGIDVAIDLSVGHLAAMEVSAGTRTLHPLHRAPWIDEPATAEVPGIAAGLARLSGDFLCAPFSTNDVEPAPGHGWPANSPWTLLADETIPGGRRARLRLERTVFGASVEKVLTLRDHHPFLYQEHVFTGGEGELPVAHHPMTRMAAGGRLSFSPKRVALTPSEPLEPDASRGRFALVYPGRSERLGEFPAAAGGTVDLTRYPVADRSEDFVVLVEDGTSPLGWTAVARAAEEDVVLVLKNPKDLPVTALWLSHGGRDYAPWNGRHTGVLGIEDGRTAVGHRSSLGDNFVRRVGVATTLRLVPDGRVAFRHVLGAAAASRPAIAPARAPAVAAGEGRLLLTHAGETIDEVPFDDEFLREPLIGPTAGR